MTRSAHELRGLGVDDVVISWRRWRRQMHLTIAEAAAMAGVSADWLARIETGSKRAALRAKKRALLEALMARWTEDMRPKKVERRGAHLRKKTG